MYLESEIEHLGRRRARHLRSNAFCEDAGGMGADELNDVPPIPRRQLAFEARHYAADAVADPPVQVADIVREEMRLGQVRRLDRQAGGGRTIATSIGAVTDRAVLRIDRSAAGDRRSTVRHGRREEGGRKGRLDRPAQRRSGEGDARDEADDGCAEQPLPPAGNCDDDERGTGANSDDENCR